MILYINLNTLLVIHEGQIKAKDRPSDHTWKFDLLFVANHFIINHVCEENLHEFNTGNRLFVISKLILVCVLLTS